MVGDIQEKILTHNGQTDEAEITTGSDPRRSADMDAGQTGATVSQEFSSTWFSTARGFHDWCISKAPSAREQLLWWCSYVCLKWGRPDEELGETVRLTLLYPSSWLFE